MTQKDLQLISVNPALAQRQLKLCEICGAKQAINDIEKRNLTHLEGKVHKGFEIIRREVERLQGRQDQIYVRLRIEREKALEGG